MRLYPEIYLITPCEACGGTGYFNHPIVLVAPGMKNVTVDYACPACQGDGEESQNIYDEDDREFYGS